MAKLRSAKLNFETWIGFDIIDNLIVAGNKVRDGDATAFEREAPYFVEVECDKLFDFKGVEPIAIYRDDRECAPHQADQPASTVTVTPCTASESSLAR